VSACVVCGQPTHARTQRDAQGRPAHLSCLDEHTPSRSADGLATAEDEAAAKELAARVAAIDFPIRGHRDGKP